MIVLTIILGIVLRIMHGMWSIMMGNFELQHISDEIIYH